MKPVKIDFMERRLLMVLQLSCSGCRKIFYYVNEENDELKPKFCPECGRKAK